MTDYITPAGSLPLPTTTTMAPSSSPLLSSSQLRTSPSSSSSPTNHHEQHGTSSSSSPSSSSIHLYRYIKQQLHLPEKLDLLETNNSISPTESFGISAACDLAQYTTFGPYAAKIGKSRQSLGNDQTALKVCPVCVCVLRMFQSQICFRLLVRDSQLGSKTSDRRFHIYNKLHAHITHNA